jgi:hypothetical protein
MKTIPVLFAASALMLVAPVQAGIVIVNHDEWTLATGTYAAQFGANIANYFAGGPGGNFLIYSNNFGLNNSTLINAITGAGHTVTANTGVTFDLPTLSAYTGIFLGGYVGGFNASVLTSYVNNGGNVYLAGGTGAIVGEDSVWDAFLNNFGFEFGPSYNGIGGNFVPSTSHPVFAGVASLYYDNGNTVILTGGNPNAQLIAVHPNGAGLVGIYEAGGVGEIPEPSTLALIGAGLLFGFLRLRRAPQS